MTELDGTGVEICGHKQAGIARAVGRIDAGARLRRGAGVGLRPAIEPRRHRLGRPVGPHDGRTKSLPAERFVESGLPRGELSRDLGMQIRPPLRVAQLMPTIRPSAVTVGPPLMPGLSAPVKWMRSL